MELGLDDLIRLPHKLRIGEDSKEINSPLQANLVKRTVSEASALFLHDTLNHGSKVRIVETLKHTNGYKEEENIPEVYCDSCAIANARRKGLSHKRHFANLIQLVDPSPIVYKNMCYNGVAQEDYEDYETDDHSDDGEELPLVEYEFKAPVAGRSLGFQSVPRFDVSALRPFEVVFVDNKDYPCAVRGGNKTAFVFICHKTRAKFKVDVRLKSQNGHAFATIACMVGMHKLPYLCTVYSDGCGSMELVKAMATQMGINHVYIPPHEQSLNEAEKSL